MLFALNYINSSEKKILFKIEEKLIIISIAGKNKSKM